MTTKLKIKILLTTILSFSVLALLSTHSAHALSGAEFQPGRIIDDAVFINKNSMTAADIQAFLNSKIPTCDRNRATTNANYPPPYTCLNEYIENTTTGESNYGRFNPNGTPLQISGGKSAAQIIWEAGQEANINPQVLIVLLQKEQGLVTDDWPWIVQYQKATGLSCPDTASCDPAAAGFYRQVRGAALQFRYYLDNLDDYWYGIGNNDILYNPNRACGSQTVNIQNAATAALYIYTPYVPNQAALNNLYGTGDSCSAYGNRNFWRLFRDWFGSTYGAAYSWSIENYTYSGGDNVISNFTTETATLTVRNTGRSPWYNHGAYPVILKTWEPENRVSKLFSTKIATLNESSVIPGGLGTFTFNIAPNQIGTYYESMNLSLENYSAEKFDWPGFRPTILVNNPYSWAISSVSYSAGTGLMHPGDIQTITLKALNTGTVTWDQNVKLGTWLPQRTSQVSYGWASPTRASVLTETSVPPGQIGTFTYNIYMPSSGYFYEKFNLVREGITWFNDNNYTNYLEGGKLSWQPIDYGLSTGTATINRNTEFNIVLRIKNTGNITWYKNSPSKINLATASPLNRGTHLYHSSWLSGNRVGTFVEESITPGQIGYFIFQANSGNIVGERLERFSLVKEGILWLNDPNFGIYLNIK